MKFNPMEFIKDVSDLLVEKITPLKESVAALQEQMKGITPYDDTKLLEGSRSNKKSIGEIFTAIKEISDRDVYKEDEVSELIKQIGITNKSIVDSLANEIKTLSEREIPAAYDDEAIVQLIEDQDQTIKTLNGYVNDLRKEITDQDAAYKKSIEDLTKQVEDKLATVKDGADGNDGKDGEFTKAINYDTEPVAKGAFVKYRNALWLNLLEGNDTPPDEKNYSYQLIIAAPKEIQHKGTYSEDEKYVQGDIVNFNSNSWFKTEDPSQAIPSAGWKLVGKQGKQGKKGEVTIVENDTTEALQELSDKVLILESELKNVSKG